MKKNNRQEKNIRGASATNISWRNVLDAWLNHHRDSASDSLQRLRRAPLQHILTAMVIGIALALPSLFMIAIHNVQQLADRWDSAPRISVFIERKTSPDDIEQLRQNLQKNPDANNVTLITPEQGLADFEKSAGLSNTMELLEENPLPPLLTVDFKKGIAEERLQSLKTEWQQLPHVDSVQADMDWLRKLYRMMQLGERITITLAALLGVGALLSVGNTIRLAIENRRSEIVVAKLVGATDAFVRRPFLYSGFWFGFSGGIVALLLVIAGYYCVIGPVAELAALYHSDFVLRGLDILVFASLMLIGIALGMLGAWLAVGQHLHTMRPR
jgi:cell division transport system permease protein